MDVSAFLREEFSAAYCGVSTDWVSRQIAFAGASHRSQQEPRRIYIAYGLGLNALALCMIKRGGSGKVLLLSRTSHRPSMTAFLEWVCSQLGEYGCRRVYTFVPVQDTDIMQAFLDMGCTVEGVLRRPYSPNADCLVLGACWP